jgi:hypothetical protein
MPEVFRYSLNGSMGPITAPRLATRQYIESTNGQIVKGSGRTVDENLLDGGQAIQGFTGQQIAYLRDLISLGAITVTASEKTDSWLTQLVANRLVAARVLERNRLEYSITPLGRAAVAQLL